MTYSQIKEAIRDICTPIAADAPCTIEDIRKATSLVEETLKDNYLYYIEEGEAENVFEITYVILPDDMIEEDYCWIGYDFYNKRLVLNNHYEEIYRG